jgi:hypothetical protein
MGRQIRFFLCDSMRAAIEDEAKHRGVKLMPSYSPVEGSIEFSHVQKEGRLWTEAEDSQHYEALCRIVKKEAAFDRDAALWVKRISRPVFESYREEKKKSLAELVEKNRRYAVEVLGGRPAK